MPKLFISTIGLNRVNGTKECIDTVLKVRPPGTFLYLTNNGSTDATKAYFDEVAASNKDVEVVHNKENKFFIDPNEDAYAKAVARGYEFFMVLNDDLIPYPGMFEALLAPFKDHQVAITGPGGGCNMLSPEFHGYGGPITDYVEGSALIVKIQILRSLRPTLFWSRLTKIYGDDSTLCLFVREHGFKIVKTGPEPKHARSQTVNRTEEIKRQCLEAQQHNHAIAIRRFGHYLRNRKFDYPIVIRRKMALGDVLLTTPIIRAIKQVQPLAQIVVETDYLELLKNNPHVRTIGKAIGTPKDALVVDLNMAYENRTEIHILDAYMDVARAAVPALEDKVLIGAERHPEMHPSLAEQSWASDFRKNTAGKNGKLVLLHAGPTSGQWAGKELDMAKWAEVATWLVKRGCHVAVVGSRPAHQIKDAIHLEGKTSLLQLAALAKYADLGLSIDSFPLHVMQAMGTPTIGVFGVTSSKYILTRTDKTIPLDGDPNDGHTGLRHRVTGRTHFSEGGPSINKITVQSIKNAIEQLLP